MTGRKPPERNPDRALFALLFFIALAIGCWFLVDRLRRDAKMQDCVMAGHRNCDPDNPPIDDR